MQYLFNKLTLILFLSLTVIACTRAVPLVNPNFEVQAKKLSDVDSAIRAALLNRRWAIVTSTPSSITAKYARGNANATILINFNKTNVNIQLLSSENLLQANDPSQGQVIHKTYASWIKNLEQDIYIELSQK